MARRVLRSGWKAAHFTEKGPRKEASDQDLWSALYRGQKAVAQWAVQLAQSLPAFS